MLYLSEPQEIEGITIYPDSSQDNVFYPIPAVPRIRRDENGKPVFRLMKFRGGDTSTAPRIDLPVEAAGSEEELPTGKVPTLAGEAAGGILTFDTEYTIDEALEPQLIATLEAQVKAKYQADNKEIPQGFKIILRQPQWSDGSVELLMEDTPNGLFESVSKTGKPSHIKNNVASFSAVLRPWQASLLESAILPPANYSPIQVSYDLKFRAKLPPVVISINASASDCYTMYKEYDNYTTRGACGKKRRHTIIKGITEKMYSRDVLNITIDSGGLTIDDTTFQQLRDMAIGMAQQSEQQEIFN